MNQIAQQGNAQRMLNGISAESWKNIQNHAARFQPVQKPSQLSINSIASLAKQMPSAEANESLSHQVNSISNVQSV